MRLLTRYGVVIFRLPEEGKYEMRPTTEQTIERENTDRLAQAFLEHNGWWFRPAFKGLVILCLPLIAVYLVGCRIFSIPKAS